LACLRLTVRCRYIFAFSLPIFNKMKTRLIQKKFAHLFHLYGMFPDQLLNNSLKPDKPGNFHLNEAYAVRFYRGNIRIEFDAGLYVYGSH